MYSTWEADHADSEPLGFLFCRPLETAVDYEDNFDFEARVAEELGHPVHFIAIEDVVHERFAEALADLPAGRGRQWVLRSWMLSAEEYTGLYEAILSRGDSLVTPPAAFEETTYLPHYYPLIAERTPNSRWIWGEDLDEAWAVAQELGPPPWIIKDHVKSAKDAWAEACFVPAGADQATFRAIGQGLLDERGDRFARGIVIRTYVDLAPLPHPDPRQVRFDEHRLLFWQGALVAAAPYHDVRGELPDLDAFRDVGQRFSSALFSVDVARLNDGGWIIIELNDGSVIQLPEQMDIEGLYQKISDR